MYTLGNTKKIHMQVVYEACFYNERDVIDKNLI